jgi:hypothetical protein
MKKEEKNRSGSRSNDNNRSENSSGDRRQKEQPGAPAVSNRQTKGEHGEEVDKKVDSKKGPNSI